jgi:hypothetical protein
MMQQEGGKNRNLRRFILCRPPLHQIKQYQMDGICSTHSQLRNAYKNVVRKPEGKSSRGKLGCTRKWMTILKMSF